MIVLCHLSSLCQISASTAATSTFDTEAREINFAGAGHDSDDNDSDDDSEKEGQHTTTPTHQDACRQNCLSSTRRNMKEKKSSKSPMDDSLEDLRLECDHAFDETCVLHDIMEWEPSFDKFQSATNKYLEEKAKND